MFTRILLPLDGTPRAEEALPFARDLALADNAQVFLLHVAASSRPASESEESAIERRIEVIARELRDGGITTHVLTLRGQAPETIATVISVHRIDLVALAPESRGLLETLWRPSVTAGLLPRLEAPVLIMPKASASSMLLGPGSHVIVPLDGSPLAERALPLARRFAERYQRGLLLLRVVPPLQVVMTGAGTYPVAREYADREFREAGEYLRAVSDQLQHAGHVPVQYMVLNGIPAEEILAEVETKPCSILVMTTHGRGGLARFLLGSVALTVARKGAIPMIITPSLPVEDAQAAALLDTPTTTPR
jgi:nucleotide-binding universal stress UspA family protein